MKEFSKNKIIIKSPAKINLHLNVIGKRQDKFHELAMIMQNIDLADYLEFEINNDNSIKLSSDSKDLSLSEDNLIIKSANLLKKLSNKKLGADIYLRKNIPIGAGLAGGSSNAAATLIGLNKLWDLALDYNTIFNLSKSLGSDVPFFINGGSQFCFGRGEILEKTNYKLNYGVLLLKNPSVSISTFETYSKFNKEFSNKYNIQDENIEFIRNDLRNNYPKRFSTENEKIKIQNDLQLVVENDNNSVKLALSILSKLENCLSFAMSGSGPTCFALFKDIDIAQKTLTKNYNLFKNNGFDSWVCKLLDKGITII